LEDQETKSCSKIQCRKNGFTYL